VRRAFLSLGFLVAGAPSALAAAWTEEPVTGVEVSWVSEHVVRGLERAGPALQARVDWSGGPWRAAAATSRALTGEGLDEAGLWFARTLEVSPRLQVEADLAWVRAGGQPVRAVRDSWEAGVQATWLLPHGAKATVEGRHDFVLRADTVEVALDLSWPLIRLGAYLDGRVWLGWSHAENWRPEAVGPPVAGGYGYWGGEVRLPYRVGAHTTLLAGLGISGAWNARNAGWRPGPGGRTNLAARIGVSLDF